MKFVVSLLFLLLPLAGVVPGFGQRTVENFDANWHFSRFGL